jgi:hypothetical protein
MTWGSPRVFFSNSTLASIIHINAQRDQFSHLKNTPQRSKQDRVENQFDQLSNSPNRYHSNHKTTIRSPHLYTTTSTMKVITANFVTCAVKECKTSAASFPLHFHDAELEQQELDFQPEFIRNVLPRVDWDSLRITANEVGHYHTTHITSPTRKEKEKKG